MSWADAETKHATALCESRAAGRCGEAGFRASRGVLCVGALGVRPHLAVDPSRPRAADRFVLPHRGERHEDRRHLDSLLPDGTTDRHVLTLGASHGEATIEVVFSRLMTMVANIACDPLSVERRSFGTGTLLPPIRGEVVVRRSAGIARDMLVSRVTSGVGAESPDAVLGELRSEGVDGGERRISIATCGGTLFGDVPKFDLLGVPTVGSGSSFHCPNMGEHLFVATASGAPLVDCTRAMPLFLRQRGLPEPGRNAGGGGSHLDPGAG